MGHFGGNSFEIVCNTYPQYQQKQMLHFEASGSVEVKDFTKLYLFKA